MNTARLTLAGLALALAVLYANLRPWWKSTRDIKQLADLGKGLGMGALAAICPGGILGWPPHTPPRWPTAAARRRPTASPAPAHRGIAHQGMGTLSTAGAVLVFLAAIATYLAWKDAGKRAKWRLVGGMFIAMTMCLTAGVAGPSPGSPVW